MAATPELVVDCRSALLKNALWVPETGLLWFLDLLAPAVHRYDPATRRPAGTTATSSAAPSPWVVWCGDQVTRASCWLGAKASFASTRLRSS